MIHPKLAQLALAGFGLYWHGYIGEGHNWRIKRGRHDDEQQLSFTQDTAGWPTTMHMAWSITTAAELSSYAEHSWSDLPDDALTLLPQELIDQLVQEN